MTYSVFGGRLNLTELQLRNLSVFDAYAAGCNYATTKSHDAQRRAA